MNYIRYKLGIFLLLLSHYDHFQRIYSSSQLIFPGMPIHSILKKSSTNSCRYFWLYYSYYFVLSPTTTPVTTTFNGLSLSFGTQIPCFSCGAKRRNEPDLTSCSTPSTSNIPDPIRDNNNNYEYDAQQ